MDATDLEGSIRASTRSVPRSPSRGGPEFPSVAATSSHDSRRPAFHCRSPPYRTSARTRSGSPGPRIVDSPCGRGRSTEQPPRSSGCPTRLLAEYIRKIRTPAPCLPKSLRSVPSAKRLQTVRWNTTTPESAPRPVADRRENRRKSSRSPLPAADRSRDPAG